MIRVLQVFYGMDCGGAENMIMNLYRNIDRTKVQFDFLVHTEKECFFDKEILSLGGRIFHAPRYNVANHFFYKKWWDKFLTEHREHTVVHGHMYSIAPIYLLVAKKHGVTTLIHSHSTSELAGIKELIKSQLRKRAKNSADYLFSCSAAAGMWLYGKEAVEKENHYILKNAVDTDRFLYNENTRNEVRKEFNIEKKLVIGHVGRFMEAKNHKFLLDVFAEVLKTDEKAVLLLVGGGSLENEIKAKAENLGVLDKVIFTGVRNDTHRLLQAMDCFVFPSIYEGLPVAVVEAQAAGIPCIISDSVTEEVCVTELATMLSLEKTPQIWAEKILEKAAETDCSDIKQQIAASGYDITATANWLQNFYTKKAGNRL